MTIIPIFQKKQHQIALTPGLKEREYAILNAENIVLNPGFYNLVNYFNLEMGKSQGKIMLLNNAIDFT